MEENCKLGRWKMKILNQDHHNKWQFANELVHYFKILRSDRKFLAEYFWKKLFRLRGVHLNQIYCEIIVLNINWIKFRRNDRWKFCPWMDDDDTAIISCIFTVNTYETFKIPSHFTFLLEIKKILCFGHHWILTTIAY